MLCVLLNVYLMTCEYLQARHDHYCVGHALLSMLFVYVMLTVLRHALLSMVFVGIWLLCVKW